MSPEELLAKIATLEKSAHIIEKSPNAQAKKWFWFKLALLYGRHGTEESLNKATTSFQNCLRIDRNDERVWQSLAEVYLARGSLLSAQKAFQMSIQIKGSHDEYAEFKVAEIQRTLGQTAEAIAAYEGLLARNPESIVFLTGLAQAKLILAGDRFRTREFEEAVAQCSAILALTSKASELRPDLSLPNDIASHCCILLALNAKRHQFPILQNQQALSNEEVLEKGISFTKTALKIIPKSAGLWHNLGLLAWLLYRQTFQSGHISASLKAIKQALCLNKHNANYWNTLGVVVSNLPNSNRFTQHALLKSIDIGRSTTEVPWTNLGVLSLTSRSRNAQNIALHSFSTAQAQEPAFVNWWLEQSFLDKQQTLQMN